MQSFRFIGAMVSEFGFFKEAILKEVKGLTNKLYAYALVRKKTDYLQNFRFIGAMVSEFRIQKQEAAK